MPLSVRGLTFVFVDAGEVCTLRGSHRGRHLTPVTSSCERISQYSRRDIPPFCTARARPYRDDGIPGQEHAQDDLSEDPVAAGVAAGGPPRGWCPLFAATFRGRYPPVPAYAHGHLATLSLTLGLAHVVKNAKEYVAVGDPFRGCLRLMPPVAASRGCRLIPLSLALGSAHAAEKAPECMVKFRNCDGHQVPCATSYQ